MGIRLEASRMVFRNPARGVDQMYHIHLYLLQGDEEIDATRHAGTVFGPTETIARMRAELICTAVNERPALQEYPAFKEKVEA